MQVSVEICSTEGLGKLGLRSILRREESRLQGESKAVSFVDSRLGQPLAQVHVFEQVEGREDAGGKKTCCGLF